MRITRKMINELELMKAIPEEGPSPGFIIAPYMEYPPPDKKLRYVMQWHIRGRSVHTDWRMEVNDHLIGWTVLTPGGIDKPVFTVKEAKEVLKKTKIEFSSEVRNKGFRAETKARQPKVWLTVEGVVQPGQVGATKEYPGVFIIVDKGYVYFGCQKPYFHEYFLKSTKEDGPFSSKDWTRVVVRAVNVQVIDPETKKPKPGKELMWRVIVPGDQTPYALSRGMKKGWVPPKGYIPIPPEWRKGEEYEKWYKWVQEAWKGKAPKEEEPEKESEDLATSKFTVHYLTYMGQIVVRGIPHQKWILRIKEGKKVRSWLADLDFTRFSPVALQYEGEVDPKWFDFEGEIPPNTEYNPTKTLTARMRIIDSGTCSIKRETVNGAEKLIVTFNGRLLNGQYIITQEEKDTPIYTIEKQVEMLKEATFVLQLHEIETPEGLKKHWDIRISDGFEFNLYADPRTLVKEGDSTKAVWKVCKDIEKWMSIDKPKTKMMVGDLVTYVTPLDKGTVNLIDISPPHFVSMIFHGEELQGYFVFVEKPGVGGIFERAKLPHALARTGNPEKGDYFEPFRVIKKEGWDYFWLEIYDIRDFTRCVEDPTKYIPELKDAPPEVLDVLVCLYPRPGKIHGARVSRVRFSDKWTVKEATNWIKSNKLHTWQGEMIRETKKASEDEILMKIIEEELKKKEKTPEERELELKLKQKKLELIEKWLKAQEGNS